MNELTMRKVKPNNIPLILTPDPSGRMDMSRMNKEGLTAAFIMLETLCSNTQGKKTSFFHTPNGF